MLPPRLDVRGVSATSAASSAQAVAAPRQEAFQRALSQMVGQTLPAQVLSKFSDGSFLVRVADTNARMLLPNGISTGDELPLTVVSGQPRATLQVGAGSPQAGQMATFVAGDQMPEMAAESRLPSQEAAILNLSGKQPQGTPGADAEAAHPGQAAAAQAQGRALSPGAALLSKAPLVPADQLPALGKDTPQAALSPAARAIASALASAYTTPGVPVTINGKTPLSAGGPPDPAKLSEGLQRALGDSGLFYESHVAEWAEGKRTLQDLQREPQMQRQGAAQGQADAIAKTLAGPDLSAAQMINQQLHTHEQGKVMWQGEAWPGQQMQWLVEREQQRDEGGGKDGRREGDGADQVWRSGVRFRFPMLGQVAASVTLVGDQVHISVQSGSEDTASTLRAWAGALQQALDAAGAPLTTLAIKAEANDGTS